MQNKFMHMTLSYIQTCTLIFKIYPLTFARSRTLMTSSDNWTATGAHKLLTIIITIICLLFHYYKNIKTKNIKVWEGK